MKKILIALLMIMSFSTYSFAANPSDWRIVDSSNGAISCLDINNISEENGLIYTNILIDINKEVYIATICISKERNAWATGIESFYNTKGEKVDYKEYKTPNWQPIQPNSFIGKVCDLLRKSGRM